MGAILACKRCDGTTSYTASIRFKEAGKVVFSESKTFDREAAAEAWMKKRETQLDEPNAFNAPDDPPLTQVIEK